MPETDLINEHTLPLTVDDLTRQFAACGLQAGQTVLVHTRMSALGWIAGGEVAVIQALLRVLGDSGTLMMPAFTADNSDPANWENPPVPASWWPVIRAHIPAYDPDITPTYQVGRVAEAFRRWPGVLRSDHPQASFAALGRHAADLTAQPTTLERLFDDDSPIGKLYDLDGYVFLLGSDHANNTSLHLAEYRATFPKRFFQEGTAMLVDGQRKWVTFTMQDIDDRDFAQIGDAYEAAHNIPRGRVGKGEVRFMRQRPLVDFAVQWMEANRH